MTSTEPTSSTSPTEREELENTHRGRQRWRRILSGAVGAAVFRTISVVGTVATVPLVVRELGNIKYGALVLITQLSTLLIFADLGLGNGLVTALSRALAMGEQERARSLISSTWFLLVGVAVSGGVLFAIFMWWVPWGRVLGIGGVGQGEVTDAVFVFAAFFAVGVPVSIAQKIHLARQEGFQAGAWQALGAILTIVATIVCVYSSANLPRFVAAGVGGSVIAGAMNCVWLFYREPIFRPRLQFVTTSSLRFLLGSGTLFLVLGVASAVAYQTDVLVIAHLLGSAEVTSYSLGLRLFAMPGVALSFILAPLWPAFSNAFALKDYAWARQTMRRTVLIGLAINIPGSVLLIIFGGRLIHFWVGEGTAVELPMLLLVSLGMWTALNAVQGPLAMWLNGAHVVKFQVVCAIIMAATNLGLSIALTRSVGVAGPIVATLVAQTLFITVPSIVYVSRMWRK